MIKKYLQLTNSGFFGGYPARPAGKTIESGPNDALVKHRKKRKRKKQITRRSRAANRRRKANIKKGG